MKLPARFVAEHVESKIVPCESEKKIDFIIQISEKMKELRNAQAEIICELERL